MAEQDQGSNDQLESPASTTQPAADPPRQAPEPVAQQQPEANPPKPEPKPKPAPEADDAGTDDPVADAIARLRSDSGDDDEPKAQPPAKPEQPKADAKPTEPPPDAAKAKPPEHQQPEADDPLKDWSREERIHTKGRVKERFRSLHDQHRKVVAERDALKADADIGAAFKKIGKDYQVAADFDTLEDEQIAWAVKAQASTVRALQSLRSGKQPSAKDIQEVRLMQEGMAKVAQALGLPSPAAVQSAAPPAELEQLIAQAEEYGIPTDKVRAWLKAGKQPAPQQQDTRPNEGKPTEQQQAGGWEQPVARKLVQMGVPEAKLGDYYDQALKPVMAHLLREENPGQDPLAAFEAMSARERQALVMEAHALVVAHQARQPGAQQQPAKPPAAPAPKNNPPASARPSHTPLSAAGGRAPGSSPRQATGDPVQDAIARLRSD